MANLPLEVQSNLDLESMKLAVDEQGRAVDLTLQQLALDSTADQHAVGDAFEQLLLQQTFVQNNALEQKKLALEGKKLALEEEKLVLNIAPDPEEQKLGLAGGWV